MNLNKAIIIGRVTQEIEMRTTPSGTNVSSFGVATNRVVKDQAGNKKEYTEFHNVVLWRRLAEIANQYLTKGSLVMIEGRLQTRSWQGKDGVTRYRTEIIGVNMQMGPKPQNSTQTAESASMPPPPPDDDATSTEPDVPDASESSTASSSGNEDEIKVEDIPF